MSLPSDECATPAWVMEFIHRRWGRPDLDVAAADWNHQAPRYFTREQDALAPWWDWSCELGYANPPYSKARNGGRYYLLEFLRRARQCVESGAARRGWVFVVPATPSVGWWRECLVRPSARHLRRERVAVGDRMGWLDIYKDGELRIEVVTEFGRVAFASPEDAKRRETGRGETALVAILRPARTRSEAIREGLRRARGRGVQLGRPPQTSPELIFGAFGVAWAQGLDVRRAVSQTAVRLGCSVRTVYRGLAAASAKGLRLRRRRAAAAKKVGARDVFGNVARR